MPLAEAPALEEGEFWAHELAGCVVIDGEREIGVVARMVALPSCEALEVGDRLIPLVRRRDPLGRRRRRGGSTSTWRSSAEAERVDIDVFTLFPHWFDWFRGQRHVANALALGHELECVDPRATTPLRPARSTTRRSAAAPGWCCAST